MSRVLHVLLSALHGLVMALRQWLDRLAVSAPRRGPALVPIPLSQHHPSRQVQRRLPWRP